MRTLRRAHRAVNYDMTPHEKWTDDEESPYFGMYPHLVKTRKARYTPFRTWLRRQRPDLGGLPRKARRILGSPHPQELEEREKKRETRHATKTRRMIARKQAAAGRMAGRNKSNKGGKKSRGGKKA